MLNLELMHHYTSHAYATFTCDPALQLVWRDAVVQTALGCDFLVRSLLAVSAVHLAKVRPEKKDVYLSTAFEYHAAASHAAAALMSDLQDGDTMNLFLFSSLTIFFGWFILAPSRRYGSRATEADA